MIAAQASPPQPCQRRRRIHERAAIVDDVAESLLDLHRGRIHFLRPYTDTDASPARRRVDRRRQCVGRSARSNGGHPVSWLELSEEKLEAAHFVSANPFSSEIV